MWPVIDPAETTYGERYPYLLQIGLERIDWGLFPARAASRLRWYGCMVWRNVADLNDVTLLRMNHLGETTIAEVHRVLSNLELLMTAAGEQSQPRNTSFAVYGTEYPHLLHLGVATVDWRLFPTRPANALRRAGVRTWADVADLNDSDALRMINLGETSVAQIRSVLANLDVAQLGADAAPGETGEFHTNEHNEDTERTVPRLVQDNLADLTRLLQWATACGADTTQGLVDLLSEGHLPKDIESALRNVLESPIDTAGTSHSFASPAIHMQEPALTGALLETVLCHTTFTQFVLAPDPPTFVLVGKELGITGEAVRRRLARESVRVRAFIAESEGWANLRWAIERRFPPDLWLITTADVEWLVERIYLPDLDPLRWKLATKLLLWLAGPYTPAPKCPRLLISDYERYNQLCVALEKESKSFVSMRDLLWFEETAAHWQIPTATFTAALERLRWKRLGDNWIPWPRNTPDRCHRVLHWAKQSMTAAELSHHVTTKSVTSLQERLLGDPRFVRVDARNRIGLVEQGYEHYKGIAETINKHIAVSGGAASRKEMLDTFPERFGVSKETVAAYLGRSGYARDGDQILLSDSVTFNAQDLEDSPNYEQWDGQWAQRLPVTSRALHGFSFAVARSSAWHNGIRPGDSLTVPLELDGQTDGAVSVIWHTNATMVTMGRAREALTKAGYVSGDELLVVISKERCRIKRMTARPENAA